jgi:prepilin-type N-terminal cleavage/methylation domain-containing protein
MTSAIGRKTPCTELVRPTVARRGGLRAHSQGGFTLLEIMLALSVVVLVAAVGVMTLVGFGEERQQLEAAAWYEAVLRHARAEAMVSGRTMRLSFDAAGRPSLMCESDPLGAPGTFDQPWEPWSHQPPTEYRLAACRRDDSRASRDTAPTWNDDDDAEFQSLSFRPDGSADWAELEIRSVRDPTALVIVVALNGFTGAVTSQTVTATEREQQAAW